ncbi:MAG: DDE-type integrase/transposase/recombinase [Erythrobacter sp.]
MGRCKNNRVENSYLPFRRKVRFMQRFRQVESVQKFVSIHANIHNHFSAHSHLIDRQTCKTARSTAQAALFDLVLNASPLLDNMRPCYQSR